MASFDSIDSSAVVARFTTPATAAFFCKHAEEDKELLAGLLAATVDGLVRTLAQFTDARQQKQYSNALLDQMRAMEQRLLQGTREQINHTFGQVDERLTATMRTEFGKVDEAMRSVDREVKSIAGAVNQQMLALITSVDAAVHRAMAQFDANLIIDALRDNIQQWLVSTSQEAEQHHDNLSAAIDGMQSQLRADIQSKLADPLASRHKELCVAVAHLPDRVQAIYAQLQHADADARNKVFASVEALRDKLEKSVLAQCKDTGIVRKGLGDLAARVQSTMAEVASMRSGMKTVPDMIKLVVNDSLQSVDKQTHALQCAFDVTLTQLAKLEREASAQSNAVNTLTKTCDALATRVDSMMTLRVTNTKFKGQFAESQLFDGLCDRLMARDGYQVERVAGQAHNCDIVVRRLGHADVRIEAKAHGEQSGGKVRAREVERFKSDLLGLNSHGIFVSLHSSIVGKGDVELEQLTNGKFAAFLGNNEYDIAFVCDFIALLQRLDKITNADLVDVDKDIVRVSSEAMGRVRLHLTDFASKLQKTKTMLKESISLLNDLTFDTIERILLGQDSAAPIKVKLPAPSKPDPPVPAQAMSPPPAPAQVAMAPTHVVVPSKPPPIYDCAICNRKFHRHWNLQRHEAACRRDLISSSR